MDPVGGPLVVDCHPASARRTLPNDQKDQRVSRGTRVISRLRLPPDVLARLNPPPRPAGSRREAQV
jgi:hypothetical protein